MADQAVNLEKSRVQNKRVLRILCPITGLFLYFMMHDIYSDKTLPGQDKPHSLLFGNTNDWPGYMHHFWPADILICVGTMWVTMHLMLRSMPSGEDNESAPRWWWAKYGAGIFIGFGSFGALVGTVLAHDRRAVPAMRS